MCLFQVTSEMLLNRIGVQSDHLNLVLRSYSDAAPIRDSKFEMECARRAPPAREAIVNLFSRAKDTKVFFRPSSSSLRAKSTE
jgi:hypothetical protein